MSAGKINIKAINFSWKENKHKYRSPDYQTSFESVGLSVQEKKLYLDFQDGSYCGHLGFPVRMSLATFDPHVTSILQMKFPVSWSFGSEEKNLEIPIRKILAVFGLQVTPILPTKFRVNWLFRSGEDQNRFSRWRLWRSYWISDQNNFSYCWSTSHPYTSY